MHLWRRTPRWRIALRAWPGWWPILRNNATIKHRNRAADGAGRRALDGPFASHPSFKPSLELYFDDHWVGIHCYWRVDGRNVFDGELAQTVIDFVEAKLGEAEPEVPPD